MMIAKHFKADPLSPSKLHWKLWAITGLLAIAGPCVHQWLSHRESQHAEAYRKLEAASQKRIETALAPAYARNRARDRLQSSLQGVALRLKSRLLSELVYAVPLSPPATRQELERELNRGIPFRTSRATPHQWTASQGWGPTFDMALFIPPDGGPPLRLFFQGNAFAFVEDSGLAPMEPLFMAEACRWTHYQWRKRVPQIWPLLVALPFVFRRHRVILAEVVMAVSLLLTVATWPADTLIPGMPTWRSLAQNADVAWAVSMVSTSGAVLTWALLRQSNACRILCPLCGYNLRGSIAACCPECGTAVPPEIRERLAAFPIKVLSPTP